MDSDSMDIPTSRRIRIPPEIVYDIFSHLSSPLRVDRAHEFPWYLGQVCSEWRSIFLSMLPYFWKEIQIEWREHLDEEDDYEHVATMLAFFLDTIRGAPFSFTLRRYGRKILSSTQLILEKLLNHSEQWEKASMQLQELEFATLHRLKNRLPLLQELRLDILRNPELEYEDASFVPPGDVFASAPLLTHINLENFSDILWGFKWSSLTGITLTYADSINIVISALRQTINLEELTIHEGFAGDEMVDTGIIGIIKLPRLRYLFLEGVSLLLFLETPALKDLCIMFQLEVDNTHSAELALADSNEWGITTAFILRSKCELSAFSATDIGSMALREILPHMPDIEQLHLVTIRGWAEIFEWLSGTEPGARSTQTRDLCLRHLDELSVTFWSLKDSDLVALQNMIAHRTIGPSILGPTMVHVETLDRPPWGVYSVLSPTVLDKLESVCRDKGVDLNLNLPPSVSA